MTAILAFIVLACVVVAVVSGRIIARAFNL
jgi:hypothetical protein